jgi:site-specific DNA recombinase
MKIAIYGRVSTQSQAKHDTIQSQLEALRKYARDHQLTITHECIDNGVSGSTLASEGLDMLRDLALAGEIEGVLVLSPDRLSRVQFDQMILMEEFKKRNIKVFFTSQQFEDTPAGNLMLQIQGAISEYERATIRDRMRRGLKHSVKNGQVIAGNTPYGYTLVRKTETSIARWEVNEAEADIVRMVFELFVNNRMKGAELARHLDDKGISTRKAAKWRGSVIYNILKNKSYLGIAYMYKTKNVNPKRRSKIKGKLSTVKTGKKSTPIDERISVPVPQLIDRKIWEAAQELLKKNSRHSRRNNSVNKYLLRGLVVCGECGSMCPGYVSNKKAYYKCGAKRNNNITTKPHDYVNIVTRQKFFDEKVWKGLTELLGDPKNLQEQIETRLPKISKFSQSALREQSKIEKDLEKLDIQDKRILDAYREEIIELDELRKQKAKISEERASLRAQHIVALRKLERSGTHEITIDTLGGIYQHVLSVLWRKQILTLVKS